MGGLLCNYSLLVNGEPGIVQLRRDFPFLFKPGAVSGHRKPSPPLALVLLQGGRQPHVTSGLRPAMLSLPRAQ